MKAKPSYYREMAQRSRDLASKALAPSVSERLLKVAEQYQMLAEEAESSH